MIRPSTTKNKPMAVPYKTKSGSKIEFTLTIEDKEVKKAEKKVLDMYRKDIDSKGFRKGHAPDEVVIAKVTPQRISFDALNQAVDDAYKDFIIDNDIHPVAQPAIDLKDPKKKPIEIIVLVEVFPEIKLGNYKKIKINPIKVKITDEELDKVIQRIMADVGLHEVVDRKAKKGDFVVVDFKGLDKEGKEIPNTAAQKVNFSIGSGQFLPDLEKAYEGMKAGEEKKGVKVAFPKEYPAKELAGNKVPFDIKLQEVQEISFDNLDKEGMKKITGSDKKTKEDFKKEVITMLEQRQKEDKKKEALDDYNAKLAKVVKVDLPDSWIQDEIESRLSRIKANPQYQEDPEKFWQAIGKTEEKLKKEFSSLAEDNLKAFLGLSEIVKVEKIELNKDEMAKAVQILEYRKSQQGDQIVQGSGRDAAELEKIKMNLRIDKYFEGLKI